MKKTALFVCLVLGSVLIVSIVTPLVYIRVSREEARNDMHQLLAEHHQQMLDSMAAHRKLMEQLNQTGGTVVATPNGFQVVPPPGAPTEPPKLALTDPKNDKTENNYLARVISEDIVGQALLASGLYDAFPTYDFMVSMMNADPPYGVQVFAIGRKGPQVQLQLSPAFAWDAGEYAKVAATALGGAKASDADPAAEKSLETLLEPTGALLAKEDVRLSARLLQNPRDAAAHEEAALVLLSLALRENSGDFSDIRRMLCRATAQLALADALTAGAAPSWNNRIADATIRVLAGRQVDAQTVLDALAQDPACPAAAKSWIAALNIWNKQDASGATVTTDSPRLLKIAWFQENMRNLPPMVAVAELDKLGQPEEIVDWSRAVLDSEMSVELGNRFCQASMGIEEKELNEILAAEGEPALDTGHLDAAFAEPEEETIAPDVNGHAMIHVVGAGTFKAATRRHLFVDIEKTEIWLKKMLGDEEQAREFQGQMLGLFQGVPYFELVRAELGDYGGGMPISAGEMLGKEGKTWKISDLPPETIVAQFGDAPMVNAYFLDGPPVGTAYGIHLPYVIGLLRIGTDWHRDPHNNDPQSNLKGQFYEYLLTMRPSSLEFARAVLNQPGPPLTADTVLDRLGPFFRYNVHALEDIAGSDGRDYTLSDEQRETVWKARCQLDPDAYFAYGNFLWNKGRTDEAVEAYRKGVAQAHDQVGISDRVGNLVDYDWDHGKKDEAMQLAKGAAAVGSQCGLETYLGVLEKSGDLDDAEQQGIAIRDGYGDPKELFALYERHPDHFAGKGDTMLKTVFPRGVAAVTVSSFSGPPTGGARFVESSALLTAAGLEQGDIIVALNGTRVDNYDQYDYVRTKATDPVMDIIAWHDGKYIEVKAAPPQHLFGVRMESYPPSSGS